MRRGLWMLPGRQSLLPLQQLPANPRNGRPHLMVLSGNLHKRIEVLRFASWLNQDRAS